MTINKTIENGTATLMVEGRLDTVTSKAFEEVINEVEKEDVTTLIIDMEKLQYISSAGLRVLLHANKVFARRGSMEIHNINSVISDIFAVTGFSEILNIQ